METHRDSPSTSATSSLPRNATTPCPFCGLSFKRLGSHLSRCKQRGGRDYSVYLSRQPARDPRPKRAKCPKCLRFFRRMDTHLRISASCRDGSITTAVRAETGSSSPGAYELSVSVPVPDPPRELPHLKPQRPLKLPKTAGEWVEADELLAAVAPAVISCRTAEEKNDVLVGMSYSYARGLVHDNSHGLERGSRVSYANTIRLLSELLPLRTQPGKLFEEQRGRMQVRNTSTHVLVSSSHSLGNTAN